MILLQALVFWSVRARVVAGIPDFRIFYTAALMLRRGQAHTLYDNALQSRTQQEFVVFDPNGNGPLPYNHPPFEAILYILLTFLPFLRAYWVWFLLNGVFLAISIRVVRPWIPAMAAEFPELLFLAPLSFYPVFYAFMEGQDSILLLMLYCLAYSALRRGRELRAGVWLGLGLFKFHLVLPFALILLLCRRWRASGGILLSAGCEVAVSWALVGWRELLYYPRYAWHVNRQLAIAGIFPPNMPNLRGLLTGWSESAAMQSRLEVLLLAVSLCLVVWASRQWKPWDPVGSNHWNTGFSIAVVTTFLVGYHGYNQDLSIALLPILLTFNRLLHSDATPANTALRIILGLLFMSPLHLLLSLVFIQQHLFALVLLAFIFCLAASCSQESGSRTPTYVVTSPA